MTQKELIKKSAEVSGFSNKDVTEVMKSLFAIIIEELKKEDEKVQIAGFGTFKTSTSAARKGINPLTKETIEIKAKRRVKFTPAKSLKQEIDFK